MHMYIHIIYNIICRYIYTYGERTHIHKNVQYICMFESIYIYMYVCVYILYINVYI